MNASGRLNTCKSSEKHSFGSVDSGERVRNAYTTYLLEEDSPGKLGVILHIITLSHVCVMKAPALKDGCASH